MCVCVCVPVQNLASFGLYLKRLSLIKVCSGLDRPEPQWAGFEAVTAVPPSSESMHTFFAGRAHHRHGPKCAAISLEQLAVRGARGPLRSAHVAQVSPRATLWPPRRMR